MLLRMATLVEQPTGLPEEVCRRTLSVGVDGVSSIDLRDNGLLHVTHRGALYVLAGLRVGEAMPTQQAKPVPGKR